ncbi:MAG: outer membrane protein assembly factor BamB, partial [Bacillota bacterium]
MTGRSFPARLAALALALLLAGCGTYNPLRWMGIISEPANKPTPLTPISATVTPKAAWTASVGKAAGFWFQPDAEGGNVYATGADGRLEVIEEATGRVSARHDLRKKLSSGVKVADGKAIVGTLKGEVLAIDSAGKQAWSADVQGEVIAPAAVSNRTVVVRTADGRIFGLALADGKRQWVYQRQAPALLLRSPAGVIAAGNDVVAGFPNGKLIALDLEDGKLVWEVTVATPRGTTDLERIADIGGLPLIDSGRLCAAAFQGKVACYDIQSRNAVWSRDLSSSSALVADAKNVYVVDDSGAVH